jgi:transmembrane sensor
MHKPDIHSKLLQYIDKYPLTEDEISAIQAWIKASEENTRYFEMLERISGKTKYIDQLKNVELDRNLARFRENVTKSKLHIEKKKNPVTRQIIFFSRIAAAFLVLMLSATGIYYLQNRPTGSIQQVNSYQKKAEVILTDGTIISLNAGSLLSYPKKFRRGGREVNLQGEAFFNVAKNRKAPFTVHLKNTDIVVLGTSFNIKEDENGRVEVHVLSGKVAFTEAGNKNNRTEINKGEKGVYDPGNRKFLKESYTSDNFLYWKTGRLSFVESPLKEVCEELERCYGIEIVILDPIVLQNNFTSECEGQQLEDILNELSILFSLHYSQEGNTVYIQSKP